ncbi:MAG: haloacid dehalogenase-like hydrolase [Planctomycetota bacterium]|nr:haloacid dehalogenase-like hydrolase [Planctomycetota bacterium]MDA1105007.1 haloacid dehalogenase-like hydrolase [Planctomycetota bacterium]
MLVLFDIDGTLLRTDGVGVRAFVAGLAAARPQRKWSLEGMTLAGQLDSRILKAACERAGEAHDDALVAAFRRHYSLALAAELATKPARAMPGMRELVRVLHERDDATIGLLTGNYSDTGRMKVASAGFDPDCFVANAFAEDGSFRRDLTVAARRRDAQRRGSDLPPESVVIVGDTPDDVDCARHHGCRALAVATGFFGIDDLRAAGACHSVTDCSDTGAILAWMGFG